MTHRKGLHQQMTYRKKSLKTSTNDPQEKVLKVVPSTGEVMTHTASASLASPLRLKHGGQTPQLSD
jgi:hypothetical protein